MSNPHIASLRHSVTRYAALRLAHRKSSRVWNMFAVAVVAAFIIGIVTTGKQAQSDGAGGYVTAIDNRVK
jgi:fluoride ion exporter CrcB/FEX